MCRIQQSDYTVHRLIFSPGYFHLHRPRRRELDKALASHVRPVVKQTGLARGPRPSDEDTAPGRLESQSPESRCLVGCNLLLRFLQFRNSQRPLDLPEKTQTSLQLRILKRVGFSLRE